MESLFEKMTGWMVNQKKKHGFKDTFVNDCLNEMTREEFLRDISEKLEELFQERGFSEDDKTFGK